MNWGGFTLTPLIPIDKLCLPESVKNKMKRDQFNDIEILELLCDDCHLKAHGWKRRK